jgi:hypothetical protein
VVSTVLSQKVRERLSWTAVRAIERSNGPSVPAHACCRARARGYGRAIQAGITTARPMQISCCSSMAMAATAEFIPAFIAEIVDGHDAFVQGSRLRGHRERGRLSPQQIAAGHLGGLLLRFFYGAHFTDLSPFRAIRRDILDRLGMRDTTYGWNLEMLMRVAAAGVPSLEIPVGQKRRIGGVSKVSGNPTASLKAAWTIGKTFVRLVFALRRERKS